MLRNECYAVDTATDGRTAEELHAVNDYDLVVLDWTLVTPSGIELLRAWRASFNGTPVLMLTERHNVEERVSGLDSGADDCLPKPFAAREFLARVRSLLRRGDKPLRTLSVADIQMDRASHNVTIGDAEVALTPKEFAILEYFLMRPGQVITRIELIEHTWDHSFDWTSNVVDVTIHRLRAKIDTSQQTRHRLRTITGVGYLLEPASD